MEGGLGVGVGGVEVGDVGGEVLGKGQVGLADSVDYAAGQFVGSVAVEVGVVVDGFGLVGVGVGGVVHEGVHGGFGAEGFEEGPGHGVEVDEGDVLLGGDLADGLGVVAEGVGDVAGGVEGVAVHGGDEDGCRARCAGFGDVLGEEAFVLVERDCAGFLVVVVELHEEVVAGLDEGEDLGEALLSDEGFDCFAGLGVVGYDYAGDEEAREHLAPGGPGFDVLIDYGGVTGEVDGGLMRGFFYRLDGDGTEAGVVAVEFEGELGVPVEVVDLAGFEVDSAGGSVGQVELGEANVDVEGFGEGFVRFGGDLFEHETACFGLDGGGGGLWASEDYGDSIAALGDGDGEEERLGGGAGVSFEVGSGVEVEAGSHLAVDAGGGECGEHAIGGAAGVLHERGIDGLGVSGGCEEDESAGPEAQ